jgi:hypothetical protein
MKQYFFDQMEWEDPPYETNIYLTDVKFKTVWVNEETGATCALVKFPSGVADPRHVHPEANQLMVPLSGEVRMPDGSLFQCNGQGVVIFEKGEPHGETVITKESLFLFYWDGSHDPVVVK